MSYYIGMQVQVNSSQVAEPNLETNTGQHGLVSLDGQFKEFGHHPQVEMISTMSVDHLQKQKEDIICWLLQMILVK